MLTIDQLTVCNMENVTCINEPSAVPLRFTEQFMAITSLPAEEDSKTSES